MNQNLEKHKQQDVEGVVVEDDLEVVVEEEVVVAEGGRVRQAEMVMTATMSELCMFVKCYTQSLFLPNRDSPFDWETSTATSGLPHRQLPAFQQQCGPTERTTRESTPLKMFQLFVTLSMLELIIEQYAMYDGECLSLSMEELLAFIGLKSAAMGIYGARVTSH